jgi:HK97 family phage major capsid protein
MSDIEKEYKQVQADLKKVGDELRQFAEQSQTEIKNHAKMSADTREQVDKLLVSQGELQARLQAAEQLVVSLENGGGGASKPKTLGENLVESEAFKNFNPNGRSGFSVNINAAAITSDDSSAGDLVEPTRVPGIITPAQRRLTVRDLIRFNRTSSNAIEYVRETGFTNSAAPVSENPANPKPQSGLTFDALQAPVATIAHHIVASKQILADASMLQAYADGRLRYGLKLKEELQLLKGSGSGLNINGIHTQATAYSNPGVTVANESKIDRLRLAMLQVALAEYSADGIVINPIDWADIELTKDSQQRYIFANPQQIAGPTLWGLPVVPTQSMDAGDFLTGSFSMGAEGWDREDVTVTISFEDRDNFVKNMATMLCEERVALTVYRPESFVKGSLEIASA